MRHATAGRYRKVSMRHALMPACRMHRSVSHLLTCAEGQLLPNHVPNHHYDSTRLCDALMLRMHSYFPWEESGWSVGLRRGWTYKFGENRRARA